MAERKPLNVVLDQKARSDLRDIWRWNAEKYSGPHADDYLDFLMATVEQLGKSRTFGMPVPGRPEYSYIVIRRSRRGFGHVAVFRVTTHAVEIMRFFHTAEDWQNKL